MTKSSGAIKWLKAQGPTNGKKLRDQKVKQEKNRGSGPRPSLPPANAERLTASSDTGAAIYRGNSVVKLAVGCTN